MITGTLNFVSFEKAVNYYSRQVPATSKRDIRQEVKEKVADGSIVIGQPAIPDGCKLIVVDCGTRYAIEG